MRRAFGVAVILALGVSGAAGEQFWYTYEGNDFPEVEGPWLRYTRAGGAQRSLQEGNLILDSLASMDIVDNYNIITPFVLDSGEWLEIDWRVRIDQTPTYPDAGIWLAAGAHGFVLLSYAQNGIWSDFESVWIDFAPGVFHQYSLISSDLTTYMLYIDAQPAHNGQFEGWNDLSWFSWGDFTEGATSMTSWDYVRFGVVPEPAVGFVMALTGLAVGRSRSRRPRRKCDEMQVLT